MSKIAQLMQQAAAGAGGAPAEFDVLVVGAGGPSQANSVRSGGGGGAQSNLQTNLAVSTGNATLVVSAPNETDLYGTDRVSSFTANSGAISVTAEGGGLASFNAGFAGYGGGGGHGKYFGGSSSGGTGTLTNGGNGYADGSGNFAGGGGGGGSGNGANGNFNTGGSGGSGVAIPSGFVDVSAFSGYSRYCGGGTGASQYSGQGVDGGGTGTSSSGPGGAATRYGGGRGGGLNNSTRSPGFQGIVVIRYAGGQYYDWGDTIEEIGGYTYHTFTTTGSTVIAFD